MPTATRLPDASRGNRPSSREVAAALCLALLGSAAPARAQGVAPAAAGAVATLPRDASLEALVNRVDQLEAEVRELRAQLAARLAAERETVAVPTPAVLTQADEPHAHAAQEDGAASDRWRAPVTQIHWFSDVGLTTSTRTGQTTSFGLGQLDLFLTSALNDQWSVLSEIVFRANTTDNRFVVNPERLMVQYRPAEPVTIAMGRFHSSVGFYNTTYHHGSWFETAATRPSIFGAGLVPFHNVGVSARTRVPSGAAGLEVFGEVGNGILVPMSALEPTQNVVDESSSKATNVGFVTRPTGVPGLQAGVSWYRDHLRPSGLTPFTGNTWAAHGVFINQRWELLNEVVAARNVDDDGAPARVSYGWYSQGAYRIGSLRPYVRYQVVQADPTDPIYGRNGHRYGPVAGLRVDFSRFAALKFQLDRSHQSAGDTTSYDGAVKLAFTF